MKRGRILLALALAAMFCRVLAAFADEVIRVEPRVRASSDGAEGHRPIAKAMRSRPTHVKSVNLGRPTDRAGAVAPGESEGKNGVPLRIGFSRAVDPVATDVATLDWESLPDGNIVATMSITSEGAAALRLGIRVERLPPDLLLRFYAPGEETMYEVAGLDVLESIARNLEAGVREPDAHNYWSPVIEGSTIVFETGVPPGAKRSDMRVSVPQISHLYASASSGFAMPKAAGACNNDVSCYSAWSAEANSVARMVFTSGGSSYLCSGTLLADSAPASFIPYFLTANHCISDQASASSLQTYWFFRSASCGAGVGSYEIRTGGAQLLYASATTDTSFMRLAAAPPAGAVFSGWIANPAGATTAAAVTGIHHPSGDLARISFGNILGFYNCTPPSSGFFSCSAAAASSSMYYGVAWRSGVVEPGSSGSALFLDNGHYVIGQLYGGSSSCADPAGGDVYGRFDVAFAAGLHTYLAAAPPTPTQLLVVQLLGDGTGVVTSSPSGIDCGTSCSASFAAGSAVALTATATGSSRFRGWGGDCSGIGACSLALDAARTVSARFDRPRLFDLDGDGSADLLWSNASDGSVQAWTMAGLTPTSAATLVPPGDYTVTHLADLDGDGKSDLLLRHGDGRVVAWIMNGLSVTASATLVSAGSGWSIVKTGDLNGDGKADLIWEHADGTVQAWLMDGTSAIAVATLAGPGSGWRVRHVADIDGDGKADLVWQHANGAVQIWQMNGTSALRVRSYADAGSGWSVALVADFNGDGNADLLWQNTDGSTQAWLMSGFTPSAIASFSAAGSGWTPVLAGDINGDGMADILWQHTNGASQAWLMAGLTPSGIASLVPPGTGWNATHLLDLNGDGRKDVLWRHVSGAVQAWLLAGFTVIDSSTFTGAGPYSVVPPMP
ncbi:MAG: FG-GAP-like repeat-containing protein [Usitatibacter sp.]